MIDILLATYNGEAYLQELLDSLKKQSYADWQLIVADDCSNDASISILEKFAAEAEQKVTIIPNEKPEGCGKNNFLKLLGYSKSDYFMFCDQDDVWLPEKIEKTLRLMQKTEMREQPAADEARQEAMPKETEAMRRPERNTTSLQAEEIAGRGKIPALVHTDLKVVDGELQLLQESFFAYSNLRKDFSLQYLICQNSVTGCTIMGNALLRKIVLDKEIDPQRLNMHDEWLALIACCFGRIAFLDEPTILYRQHGKNTVGATDAGNLRYQLKRLLNTEILKKSNMDHVREAEYFLELYGSHLHQEKKKAMLQAFASASRGSRMAYRKTCLQQGILKYPGKRALIQLLLAQK